MLGAVVLCSVLAPVCSSIYCYPSIFTHTFALWGEQWVKLERSTKLCPACLLPFGAWLRRRPEERTAPMTHGGCVYTVRSSVIGRGAEHYYLSPEDDCDRHALRGSPNGRNVRAAIQHPKPEVTLCAPLVEGNQEASHRKDIQAVFRGPEKQWEWHKHPYLLYILPDYFTDLVRMFFKGDTHVCFGLH